MTADKMYVGQVVYKHYTPAAIGTVVEIVGLPNTMGETYDYFGTVRVRWDNTKRGTTDESAVGLADYETLVVEHERKAVKHRSILETIREANERAR